MTMYMGFRPDEVYWQKTDVVKGNISSGSSAPLGSDTVMVAEKLVEGLMQAFIYGMGLPSILFTNPISQPW